MCIRDDFYAWAHLNRWSTETIWRTCIHSPHRILRFNANATVYIKCIFSHIHRHTDDSPIHSIDDYYLCTSFFLSLRYTNNFVNCKQKKNIYRRNRNQMFSWTHTHTHIHYTFTWHALWSRCIPILYIISSGATC